MIDVHILENYRRQLELASLATLVRDAIDQASSGDHMNELDRELHRITIEVLNTRLEDLGEDV